MKRKSAIQRLTTFQSGRFTVYSAANERRYRHEIGYYFDRRSGCFIVTWTDRTKAATSRYRRQQLAAQPLFFECITGINRDAIAGLTLLTSAQLDELGFVRNNGKEAAAHVNILPIAR